mgnify:CR=1|jgi:hypothetical protein
MKSSKKIILAIATIGLAGMGSLAVAQQGSGYCDGPMGMMGGGMRGMRMDPAARVDQHMSRLKADLKLTPQQEPLWQAFAEKAKAEAGKGIQAMRDNAQDLSLSAPDRMARMTEIMKQRVAVMESVHASFKQMYDSLSADQKRVADIHAARMGSMGRHRGPMMGHRGAMPPPPPPAPGKN